MHRKRTHLNCRGDGAGEPVDERKEVEIAEGRRRGRRVRSIGLQSGRRGSARRERRASSLVPPPWRRRLFPSNTLQTPMHLRVGELRSKCSVGARPCSNTIPSVSLRIS
ncbi:hypothetical protein B296_00051247 [Ensete ventricosum]|uniref:Uncharacterized protein n=1 Tax=Ensete ventricosum TaxID=4639 RepID=A0A426YHK0_ENSVE|nr:hypothetical protein B296_00051247 [Ensete ventricosum]